MISRRMPEVGEDDLMFLWMRRTERDFFCFIYITHVYTSDISFSWNAKWTLEWLVYMYTGFQLLQTLICYCCSGVMGTWGLRQQQLVSVFHKALTGHQKFKSKSWMWGSYFLTTFCKSEKPQPLFCHADGELQLEISVALGRGSHSNFPQRVFACFKVKANL